MHCCLQCHFLDHGIEIQFLFHHIGLDNIVHLPHDYCHASSTSHRHACQSSKHTQRMDHLQWLCTKNSNKQKSGQNIRNDDHFILKCSSDMYAHHCIH